jgi:hypothetical protein
LALLEVGVAVEVGAVEAFDLPGGLVLGPFRRLRSPRTAQLYRPLPRDVLAIRRA